MAIKFDELLEALDLSLDEDFWDSGKEFDEFISLLNTEFDNSGWNSWNQARRDRFAEKVAKRYLEINPTPTPMFFQDLTDNNYHTERRAFARLLNKSSLNESSQNKRDEFFRYCLSNDMDYELICDILVDNLDDTTLSFIMKDIEEYNDFTIDESLNEDFEISVRSRFTPQKLKVLVNKAINNSGFPIEDIDKIEWLPGRLFKTKDIIYIMLKDNTEIPIVLDENNIENSIITALHRVLKYDKKYAE